MLSENSLADVLAFFPLSAVIRAGTKAAEGVSAADMAKRERVSRLGTSFRFCRTQYKSINNNAEGAHQRAKQVSVTGATYTIVRKQVYRWNKH